LSLTILCSLNTLAIVERSYVVSVKRRHSPDQLILLLLLLQNKTHDDDLNDEYVDYIHIRDRRIPRNALDYPIKSPWEYIYQSGNDQAFITFLGFDKHTLDVLVEQFVPYYNTLTPHRAKDDAISFCLIQIPDISIYGSIFGGRPRLIDA
jgi:hypothetical protein